jgi:hypothetical protein
MNQRDTATRLGISRTWLQVLERRALQKIAAATGGTAPITPRWQEQYESGNEKTKAYKRDWKRKRRAAGLST